ncbi:TOBE domain-containing protein, partial [Desulfosarcina cetonica]|uniref:TOBE domain-containing protein n=1 Tax=Desulfosarcina cetonica TaxID=90730 RepID=UPI0006CFBD15
IRGRVVSRTFGGQSYRTGVALTAETRLVFQLPSETPPPAIHAAITLDLNPAAMAVLPEPPWPPHPKETQ